MSSYMIPAEKMQSLIETLRPEMIKDPAFMSECQRCMTVMPDKVIIYLDRSHAADPRLHKACIEFGDLNR